MSQPLTQLLQVLPFVNVAPSATVSLPYTLNQNGTPVVPDIVAVDAAGFTVTANGTQVSVTNTGADPASINALCWRVHTTPRELGGAIQNMTPQPFVIATGSGGGGPTAPTVEHITPTGGPPHTGVADPTIDVTFIAGTGAASTVSLADGTTDGFEKTIYGGATDGGLLITPAHFADGTSILIASGSNGGFILRWDATAVVWCLVGQGANLTINP